MKIDMRSEQPVIDANDLGPLLGIEPGAVQDGMRRGEITSKYEIGQDADAGRFRLTFFYRGIRVRLTCAADGTVISRIRTMAEQS
ncbi:DUF6522 family protein [Pseudosulfitobacter sp. DSM 107133]|uniref:DUF6522 family protein n=1 Tax=Pseudosulfitobacter sp. DSM 107133 TaxID=2883100 RepID=UPI000DF1C805|nr:DUF6522 family protein [Pseudosulfitobacter sp. DSM 107133]UOA27855.1 hypothetical protein DSM107133_02594 [Pseudosulfitobacter sp. DSM 107133]